MPCSSGVLSIIIHYLAPPISFSFCQSDPIMALLGLGVGFDFSEGSYRDVFEAGTCDDGVRKLAGLLGWEVSHACMSTTSPSVKMGDAYGMLLLHQANIAMVHYLHGGC